MNPLAISQERIQGIVWLVSLIGTYLAAWKTFEARKLVPAGDHWHPARVFLVLVALCLMILGSCTWYFNGADIVGRLLHPALFVQEKQK